MGTLSSNAQGLTWLSFFSQPAGRLLQHPSPSIWTLIIMFSNNMCFIRFTCPFIYSVNLNTPCILLPDLSNFMACVSLFYFPPSSAVISTLFCSHFYFYALPIFRSIYIHVCTQYKLYMRGGMHFLS